MLRTMLTKRLGLGLRLQTSWTPQWRSFASAKKPQVLLQKEEADGPKSNEDEMKKKETKVKKRMNFLQKKLETLRVAYYQKEAPIAKDEEYDALFAELQKLEQDHPLLKKTESATERPGPKKTKQDPLPTIVHLTPMLGLDNIYTSEEVIKFVEKLAKHQKSLSESEEKDETEKDKEIEPSPLRVVTELKYDGMALSLCYRASDGVLVSAATRGTGTEGEDVKKQVFSLLSNVPHQISVPESLRTTNSDIRVRGEIVAKRSTLEAINNGAFPDLCPEGKKFSGCRNLVTGLINRRQTLDPSQDPQQNHNKVLDFVAYDLFLDDQLLDQNEEVLSSRHWDRMSILSEMGFHTDTFKEVHENAESVVEFVEKWNDEQKRKKLVEYDTDGVVIKADDKKLQHSLGQTSRVPRSMIAFKFSTKKTVTKLLDIQWQIGRTGKCTPVACLDPVSLSDSIVSRATLHNFDFILRNSIHPGALVSLERSGGVIPKVVGVVSASDDLTEIKVNLECPCEKKSTLCARKLSGEDAKQSVDLFCEDKECPEQKVQQYIYFFKTIGVAGAAEGLVKKLIQEGLIGKEKKNHLVDVFSLPLLRDQLLQLDGWGIKKTDTLCKEIEKASSSLIFQKALEAIGISSVGSSVSKIVSQSFTTFSDLSRASESDLLEKGLSKSAAASLSASFQSEPSPLPWLSQLDEVLQRG